MMACTRYLPISAEVGSMNFACPECGHSMIVHPGFHNTSVDHCVLCDLVDITANPEDIGQGPLGPDVDDAVLRDFHGLPQPGDDD
jgi:hypothetical protein